MDDRLNTNLIKKKSGLFMKGGGIDMPFFLLTVLLLIIGLIMLYSASYVTAFDDTGSSTYYLKRQVLFAAVGLVIALLISRVNYQYFRALSVPALLGSLLLLVLVLLVGTVHNHAKRWLDIGITEFQPSEVAKISVIMCFATMISSFGPKKMKTFKYGVLPFVVIIGIIAALMMEQPHLSGAIIIAAIGGAMMLLGGVHLGWFAGAAGIMGIGGYFAATKLPHVIERLAVWKDPWIDKLDSGYQSIQSIYALGSGGLLGLGLGNSRQKYMYLPEEFNDYIFAIIGEELGYIGALVVLLLFALFIVRGFWLAMHTRDRFGSLLISGIMTMFAIQVFLNVAVVSTLIPATGISFPFFSYGGSALLIQLAEVGIVLAVSRQNEIT